MLPWLQPFADVTYTTMGLGVTAQFPDSECCAAQLGRGWGGLRSHGCMPLLPCQAPPRIFACHSCSCWGMPPAHGCLALLLMAWPLLPPARSWQAPCFVVALVWPLHTHPWPLLPPAAPAAQCTCTLTPRPGCPHALHCRPRQGQRDGGAALPAGLHDDAICNRGREQAGLAGGGGCNLGCMQALPRCTGVLHSALAVHNRLPGNAKAVISRGSHKLLQSKPTARTASGSKPSSTAASGPRLQSRF